MKIKKKIISIVTILCICATIIPLTTTEANAAVYTYSTLKISSSAYDTVAKGTISAVKMNGAWYYKFKYGTTTVYIKTTAFSKSYCETNSLGTVNSTLTNKLNAFQNYGVGYVWKNKSISTSSKYTTHKNTLSKYIFNEYNGSSDIVLKCNYLGSTRLDYKTKVYVYPGKYVTPSTAQQYKLALTRSSTNVSKTPVAELKVTMPGNTKTYLNKYRFEGKGYGKSRTYNAAKYVSIAYKTGLIAASAATANGSGMLSSFVGVVQEFSALSYSSSSSKYTSDGEFALSVGTKKALRANYSAPIVLKNNGDYFQSKTYLKTVFQNPEQKQR